MNVLVNSQGAALPGSAARRLANLGWLLWSVAIALPWLVPTHAEPWTTFYSEWSMAVVMLPLGIWAVLATRGPWRADILVCAIAACACVPVLQAFAGAMFIFPGEAWLIALYIGGFALTILVARQAETAAPMRLIEALFAGLAVSALLSACLAIYQWLGLESLGVLINAAPTGRAVANVGQPNNLSTLLVWGVIAIWWGYARRRLSATIAFFALMLLLLGVALTQSRTGAVSVCALALLARLARRQFPSPPRLRALIALALWFVLCALGTEPLSQLMHHGAGRDLAAQVSPGTRPMVWTMALDAIRHQPWFGYGWNQSIQAQMALSERFPNLHETIQFAHNVVLDLLLWNGVPLGLLMACGLGLWFRHQLRAPLTQERLLVLLALGAFMFHAMLELPHAIAFFLLPVAVMMGTLSAWRPLRGALAVPRMAVGLVVLSMAGALGVIFLDYQRIEAAQMSFRFREARIGNVVEKPAPKVLILGALESALTTVQMHPTRNMAEAELQAFRRAVLRYPSYGSLLRYARASALNGRPAEAGWALSVLCRLKSEAECLSAGAAWRAFVVDGNPEMARVQLPPEMLKGTAGTNVD